VRNATEAACYELPLAGATPPIETAASPDMTKAKNE